MENPFEAINKRLDNIELMLDDIKNLGISPRYDGDYNVLGNLSLRAANAIRICLDDEGYEKLIMLSGFVEFYSRRGEMGFLRMRGMGKRSFDEIMEHITPALTMEIK